MKDGFSHPIKSVKEAEVDQQQHAELQRRHTAVTPFLWRKPGARHLGERDEPSLHQGGQICYII